MTKIKSIKHTTKNFKLLYDLAVEVSNVEETSPARLGEIKFLANDALQKLNNTQKQ